MRDRWPRYFCDACKPLIENWFSGIVRFVVLSKWHWPALGRSGWGCWYYCRGYWLQGDNGSFLDDAELFAKDDVLNQQSVKIAEERRGDPLQQRPCFRGKPGTARPPWLFTPHCG
jgi:hypothetical protein